MKRLVAICLCLLLSCSVMGVAGAETQPQELRTVTILATGAYEPWLTAEYNNFESGKLFDEAIAKLGLRIEIEGIEDASFMDVVNSRIAAGVDLPDIIGSSWNTFDAVNWAKNGMILSVSDLIAQYDEDGSILAYYNEKCPGAVGATTAPDGNMYWFSYLAGRTYLDQETGEVIPQTSPRTSVIRKDWLDQLNIEYKYSYTPDELFDILVAFRENDVNGTGVADEVANITFDDFWNGLAKGFGLSHKLLCSYDENNQVYSNFYHENFDEYITFMQKLYEADLLDTSTLVLAGTLDNALQTENKASINFGYGWWEGYENNCSDENALYLPFWLDPDGLDNGFYAIDDPAVNAYCQYVVTKDCKDLQAVMDLFDFVYTDEYALIVSYGIEHVGYEMDERGVVIPATIPGDAETFDARYGAAWAGLAPAALPNMRTDTVYYDLLPEGVSARTQAKNEVIYDWTTDLIKKATIECAFDQLAIATDEELEVIGNVEEQLKTYASELLVDLIMGRKSLDDMDVYRGELEKLGLNEYMEVIQAQRDRYVSLG